MNYTITTRRSTGPEDSDWDSHPSLESAQKFARELMRSREGYRVIEISDDTRVIERHERFSDDGEWTTK